MSFAQVIDVAQLAAQEKVVFGATVTLENTDDDVTVRYQIVGEDEADKAKQIVHTIYCASVDW